MILLPLISSLLLGSAGSWFMSRYAYRFGLLDIPHDRSSHNLPTPRGGGIGILAAVIAASLLLQLPITFWIPASMLSLVSFFDDKLGLTPRARFIFQFAAALVVTGYIYLSPIDFQIQNPKFIIQNLTLLLSCCIFIVGTTNFFNFMDGINGIAAITGMVGFALMSIFASQSGFDQSVVYFCLCISTACLGFLPFNVPTARVFMGDVGSILLGFLFATLCVLLARTATDFLVLCGFLSTFYADALTTLYIRMRDGERLSQAHRRHMYQLMANQMGIPHWKVSLGYGVLQGAVGVLLLLLRQHGLAAVIPTEIFLCLCWWSVSLRFRRIAKNSLISPS